MNNLLFFWKINTILIDMTAFSLPPQSHVILSVPCLYWASYCHRPFAHVWLFIFLSLINFISFLDPYTLYFHRKSFSLSGVRGIPFSEICLYPFMIQSHFPVYFHNGFTFCQSHTCLYIPKGRDPACLTLSTMLQAANTGLSIWETLFKWIIFKLKVL